MNTEFNSDIFDITYIVYSICLRYRKCSKEIGNTLKLIDYKMRTK